MLSKPTIYPDPPPAPPPQALGFPDLRQEWRIVREMAHLAIATPELALAPRGSGQPVILSPGWRASQHSMEPLRRFLARKRFDARHWGLGTNQGDVQGYVNTLVPRVLQQADATGKPVALVGWSLGGVVSREVARELPDAVSCVITFGSPVVGGPLYTVNAANVSGETKQRMLARIAARERERQITVPMSTVFSRLDSIVDWPACIDRYSPNVTHYEVSSTHLSMGLDPVVWRIVLDTLLDHA